MFHNYRFRINSADERTLTAYLSVKVTWEDKNLNSNAGGGFCLFLGDSYIYLNMDPETKRISGIDSEEIRNMEAKSIRLPAVPNCGILTLCEDGDFPEGCGTRICFRDRILYDKNQKLLQIGNSIRGGTWVKFLNNAYAQLDRWGHLQTLLVTNIEVD